MNWLLASSFMFISSVILYLLVRKSSLAKIPYQFQNLAMFAVPFIVYIGSVWTTNTNLAVNLFPLLIIAVMAFFFSYLGSIFSLKSIEAAPNPGYSLVLSKSYVVFTSLIAIPLFHATLNIKSGLAIILIIFSSALVMISKNKGKSDHTNFMWLPLAFGAFFCWGLLSLTSRYLQTIGVNTLTRLVYMTFIVSILIVAEMIMKKIPWKNMNKFQWFLFIGIGLASSAFNYFMQLAINTAPNIGFVNAINSSSIAAVTIFSSLLFRDELTKRKLFGVFGIITGLILLVL